LRCFHRLYPEYFNQVKAENPDTYVELVGHTELPMDDILKRNHVMFDLICTMFIAEVVDKWLEGGVKPKEQGIMDRDCYVVKSGAKDQELEFNTLPELVVQYIQMNGPAAMTPSDLERAMKDGMQRWMEVLRNNVSELETAYEKLKSWRFETPPTDDLFEKKYAVDDIIHFRI